MDGKIAVVAGLESLLRTALAERLRDEGAEVLSVEGGAEGGVRAGQRFGRIDALVNVMRGADDVGPFAQGASETLEALLGQVAGFAAGMRAAWPFLLKGTAARVVNVCAPQGATTMSHFAETVTADAALQGLTRAVSVEWARRNVLVNCLVPGLVDLPEIVAFRERQPELFAKRLENTALQRLGDPVRDIGGALMLLLSDEGCYIVGHPVYADGGQHLSTAAYDPGGYAVMGDE